MLQKRYQTMNLTKSMLSIYFIIESIIIISGDFNIEQFVLQITMIRSSLNLNKNTYKIFAVNTLFKSVLGVIINSEIMEIFNHKGHNFS